MQQLVDAIRGAGAPNLFIAEGLAAGESLARLPQRPLSGSDIVYGVHPHFGAQHQSQADWDADFGPSGYFARYNVTS